MNGGALEVGGNILCTHAYANSVVYPPGTPAAITLNGTADQTITQTAGTFPGGTWTNSNTAGVILQATPVILGGALLVGTDAKWCMEGHALTASSITNDGIIYRHGAGLPSPNPTPPPLDESHIAGGGEGPALLSRTATITMARQNSSKRSIGRTGNILLRRRHRRLLG